MEADATTTAIEMPRYQSHKKVWALKIASIDGHTLHFGDVRYGPRTVDASLFSRGTPNPGDYLVVYDDNYMSFSPAKAFEEGYILIGS